MTAIPGESNTGTSPTALLGGVLTEILAAGTLHLCFGLALVVLAAAGGGSYGLIGALAAASAFAVLAGTRWPPLVRKSFDHAKPMAAGAVVEPTRSTGLRAAVRLAGPAAVLAAVAAAAAPRVVDGVTGGILMASGVLLLGGYVRARRWQRQHRVVLVRKSRRWSWAPSRTDSGAESRQGRQRRGERQARIREAGWEWYTAPM
jgi:hypothetical protein